MNEAMQVYMRASLLARNIDRMEQWSDEDLLLAFHCRDSPTFEVFCGRVGIPFEATELQGKTRKRAKASKEELSANAENFLNCAKLLASHRETKNIVSIEEVKEPAKDKVKSGA